MSLPFKRHSVPGRPIRPTGTWYDPNEAFTGYSVRRAFSRMAGHMSMLMLMSILGQSVVEFQVCFGFVGEYYVYDLDLVIISCFFPVFFVPAQPALRSEP